MIRFVSALGRRELAPIFRRVSSVTMSGGLNAVADVDIDPAGVFKYILIQAKDAKTGEQKHIVRGYKRCGYHADIFDETERKTPNAVALECLGGGRIKHEPDANKLEVYGYSTGFGRADHKISVEILRKRYPNYEITWSNDGY